MPKFRKRPVVIEAHQLVIGSHVPEGVNFGGPHADDPQHTPHPMHGKHWVSTLEGPLIASDRDWIITGIQGERYPCKPEIFAATYEPVEDTVF